MIARQSHTNPLARKPNCVRLQRAASLAEPLDVSEALAAAREPGLAVDVQRVLAAALPPAVTRADLERDRPGLSDVTWPLYRRL